ncbi:MAG: phage holin family protein [Anaerolineae bacterium]|nr:phage holin family protein [Anaerolineae bacterium]
MSKHQREGFDLDRFLIRWMINAAAIWVAIRVVPGIVPMESSFEAYIIIALIFGLVNAVIRPLVTLLTCPLIILTLGLGTLLINTAMFWLAGEIGQKLGYGFTVDGFWPAFWGALVVSIVSAVLSGLVGGRRHQDEA